jgi:hypothetical protein
MKFTLSMLMLLVTLGVAFYFGYKLDFNAMENEEAQVGQSADTAPIGGVRVQGGVNFGSSNSIGGVNTGYRPAQTAPSASRNCIQGARC